MLLLQLSGAYLPLRYDHNHRLTLQTLLVKRYLNSYEAYLPVFAF